MTLKARLRDRRIVVAPGIYDAFSARLEQTQIGIPEEFSWQRAPMASR